MNLLQGVTSSTSHLHLTYAIWATGFCISRWKIERESCVSLMWLNEMINHPPPPYTHTSTHFPGVEKNPENVILANSELLDVKKSIIMPHRSSRRLTRSLSKKLQLEAKPTILIQSDHFGRLDMIHHHYWHTLILLSKIKEIVLSIP